MGSNPSTKHAGRHQDHAVNVYLMFATVAVAECTIMFKLTYSRWGASASEVIFVNRPLATFWSLGKVVFMEYCLANIGCLSRWCQSSGVGAFTSLL